MNGLVVTDFWVKSTLAHIRTNMGNDTKLSKKAGEQKAAAKDEAILKDPRFASVYSDPRFKRIPRKHTKVSVDSRFQGIFKNEDFNDTPAVDKRGRKLDASFGMKKMQRFYELDEGVEEDKEEEEAKSDEEDDDDEDDLVEEEEDEDEESGSVKETKPKRTVRIAAEKSDAEDSESEEEAPAYDFARGIGVSSSEDESDTDIESDEFDEGEEIALERDEDIPRGEETRRFAVVNMDWDNLKAVHLLSVFAAFKPDTGVIKSVTVYPSEFGKQRMEIEDTQGPPKELFMPRKKDGVDKFGETVDEKDEDQDEDEDEDEDEEGDGELDDEDADQDIENEIENEESASDDDDDRKYDVEDDGELMSDEEGMIKLEDGSKVNQVALRRYQLERLKYYYAVIECDSVNTARVIYNACDGTEFERSANFFDLRFIPDDVTFDDEPRDRATQLPANYEPRDFSTNVLQQTNLKIAWDEDDPDRIQITRRPFTDAELENMEFSQYLASSDSEEEDEANTDNVASIRSKYIGLLGNAKDLISGTKPGFGGGKLQHFYDKSQEVEITFTPGLSEAANEMMKNEEDGNETTIESYLRKKKEKRLAKKAEKKAKKAATTADEDKQDKPVGKYAQTYSDDDDVHMADDPYFANALNELSDDEAATAVGKPKPANKQAAKKLSAEEMAEQERERAELDLLMLDDGNGISKDGNERHFNMKDIIKAEKMAGGKKKHRGKKRKAQDMSLGTGDFRVDVDDPRFAAIYKDPQFAIDPSNPKFIKTSAMSEILRVRKEKRQD